MGRSRDLNPQRRSLIVPLILGVLLAVGYAVRVWGIDFGLPNTQVRPDEDILVLHSLGLLGGDLDPGFFHYGSVCFYGLAAAFEVLLRLGGIAPLAPGADLRVAVLADPAPFHLVGRHLAAIAGTATILATYFLARRFCRPTGALAAAGFLAVSHLHVRDSHFATTDVVSTLFLVLGVWSILRAHDGPSPRSWLLAGALCGLATSTKYIGVLAFPAAALAAILAARRTGVAPLRALIDRRWLAFPLAFSVTFLCGTPYAVLDFETFRQQLMNQSEILAAEGVVEGPRAWFFHATFALPHGLGLPVLLSGVAGLGLLVRRSPACAAILLVLPVLYFAGTGTTHRVFLRYALPLTPFLCVGAGAFVQELAGWRLASSKPAVAAAVLSTLFAAPSLLDVVRHDRLLAAADTRIQAHDWMQRRTPAGSTVWVAALDAWSTLHVYPPLEDWRSALDGLDLDREERERNLEFVEEFYASRDIRPWVALSFDPAAGFLRGDGRVHPGFPDWVVLIESPKPGAAGHDPAALRLLDELYAERVVFGRVHGEARFDRLDAFFVPFAGLSGVESAGPVVRIFERKT